MTVATSDDEDKMDSNYNTVRVTYRTELFQQMIYNLIQIECEVEISSVQDDDDDEMNVYHTPSRVGKVQELYVP